jgi:bifunctional non-homologous end joining protein LigD
MRVRHQTSHRTHRDIEHPALAELTKALKHATMPKQPALMQCTLVAEPFDDPNWIFEPKLDGLRVLCWFDGHRLRLLSRQHKAQNAQFPDLIAALHPCLPYRVILDGEVVCLDARGRSSFRLLQQRLHLQDPTVIKERMRQYPAYLYLFDLLYLDHYDVTGLPLEQRKRLLRDSVRWTDCIRWTEYTPEAGTELFQDICHQGGEGIIGKHRQSPYVPERSRSWVKIKCLGRQEFVIGGFTDPKGSRVGLGALLVGFYSDDGRSLVYAGKVGTGFTSTMLLDLRRRLDALQQERSPFDQGTPSRGADVYWVIPALVAEIAFAEWTHHGKLRQPCFVGLRLDKRPQECRRERPQPPPTSATGDELQYASPRQRDRKGRTGGKDHAHALEAYAHKRHFGHTPEPRPQVGPSHRQPIFVVQEHHASRLHYDFRLEAEGVLKSWALPKQPTLDPSVKRLAVRVEDHPLAYADFSGEIPAGQYGAGIVRLWDRGTYENLLASKGQPQTIAEGIEAGHLEVILHGRQLKGGFALIRMRRRGPREYWLLIKMKDEATRPGSAGDSKQPAPDADHGTRGLTTRGRPGDSHQLARSPAARPSATPMRQPAVVFTHTDKVMFPEAGITKGEVLRFYERISERMLPHLRDRPVTLERLPEGVTGTAAPHFWQKHTPSYYPAWIPRVKLPSEHGHPVSYVLVNDQDTLLYLVNQGALTLHVWLSRIHNLDRPDFVLFDLDPGKASFTNVVTVAQQLHKHLQAEAVASFVKTSGKTGLHVLVPWEDRGGYAEARDWARQLAQAVVAELPEVATLEARKANRRGRVYVDVLQNARGHHAVPPYVLRAVPQACVSTPLAWDELIPHLHPQAFTLRTIFDRLASQPTDPIAPLIEYYRREGAKSNAER